METAKVGVFFVVRIFLKNEGKINEVMTIIFLATNKKMVAMFNVFSKKVHVPCIGLHISFICISHAHRSYPFVATHQIQA